MRCKTVFVLGGVIIALGGCTSAGASGADGGGGAGALPGKGGASGQGGTVPADSAQLVGTWQFANGLATSICTSAMGPSVNNEQLQGERITIAEEDPLTLILTTSKCTWRFDSFQFLGSYMGKRPQSCHHDGVTETPNDGFSLTYTAESSRPLYVGLDTIEVLDNQDGGSWHCEVTSSATAFKINPP